MKLVSSNFYILQNFNNLYGFYQPFLSIIPLLMRSKKRAPQMQGPINHYSFKVLFSLKDIFFIPQTQLFVVINRINATKYCLLDCKSASLRAFFHLKNILGEAAAQPQYPYWGCAADSALPIRASLRTASAAGVLPGVCLRRTD